MKGSYFEDIHAKIVVHWFRDCWFQTKDKDSKPLLVLDIKGSQFLYNEREGGEGLIDIDKVDIRVPELGYITCRSREGTYDSLYCEHMLKTNYKKGLYIPNIRGSYTSIFYSPEEGDISFVRSPARLVTFFGRNSEGIVPYIFKNPFPGIDLEQAVDSVTASNTKVNGIAVSKDIAVFRIPNKFRSNIPKQYNALLCYRGEFIGFIRNLSDIHLSSRLGFLHQKIQEEARCNVSITGL